MIEYYFTIACKMFWKWKKQSPKEARLSHREHCFWNALSVVPPLNLWLLDITLIMSNICIIYVYISGRSEANWKLKTQQTGHVVSGTGSGMCELTNQSGVGIQKVGALKETGSKPRSLRQRRNTIRKLTLSIKAYKPILVVTQTKMLNLRISVMCLL